MNKLTMTFARLLCLALLTAPWTLVQALDTFEDAGEISKVEYEKITIRSQGYRPSPDIVVVSGDSDRTTFAAFQKGDVVWMRGKVLGNVYYVDEIRYQEPDDH